jgi:tetratricopeptide (TPR) repeat protein
VLALAALVAICCAVYANTLYNGFVYDDNGQILNNPWIKDFRFLPDIFTRSVWSFQAAPTMSNYYRPLMHVVALVNYHLFGFAPWGFHLVNVLLHAGTTVLVFLLAGALAPAPTAAPGAPPATRAAALLSLPFVAALLFAVHPIHTEVVAWVAAVPELSFTLFVLLSLLMYVAPGSNALRSRVLSVGAFFVALLCKETALMLLPLLAAYDVAFPVRGRRLSQYLGGYLPYVLAAGAYLPLRLHALGSFAPVLPLHTLQSYSYVANVFPLFVKYLGKLLFPFNLNAFHTYQPIGSLAEARGLFALLATGGYLLLAALAYARNRLVFFALALVAVPLLPAFSVPAFSQAPFSERYLYLPSVGFVLLLGVAFDWLRRRPAPSAGAALALVAALTGAYALQTIARNPVWKDDLTLFEDTVRKSPDAEIPRGMLGIALTKAGRFDDAEAAFHAVLKLNPDSANAHYNLGLALLKKGAAAAAIPAFEKALALTPDDTDAHRFLAIACAQVGRYEEALAHYRRHDRSSTASFDAYVNLGRDLENRGDPAGAIALYRHALARDPEQADVSYALENLFVRTGRIAQELPAYEAQVALRPDSALMRNLLGIAYAKTGAYERAEAQFAAAVRLDPAKASYRTNLDGVLALKKSAGAAPAR